MRFSLILLTVLCLGSLGSAQARSGGATRVSALPASHASIPGSRLGLSPDCTKNPLGECLWQVSFAIDGVPGQAVAGPSLGSGYRSTLARGGISTTGKTAGESRSVLFVYQYANGKMLTVALNVFAVVGAPKLTGPIKHITVQVGVQVSVPGCGNYTVDERGRGTLALFDLGTGRNDYAILTICGRTRSYKLGQPGQARAASVVVSIKPL